MVDEKNHSLFSVMLKNRRTKAKSVYLTQNNHQKSSQSFREEKRIKLSKQRITKKIKRLTLCILSFF